ncbi:unnamed protein product [Lactuca virosa]|uniref:Uncharacterized protein n=1 Tax=Lactuca virosa TaxID=75947 RepID=A0AAU9MHS8_9ASTR|nr:unnamed protein product [Lactuca virosa]
MNKLQIKNYKSVWVQGRCKGARGSAHSLEIARDINQKGPVAIRMAKKVISHGSEMEIGSGLELEEECYEETLVTDDRLEGLNAFSEKRKPLYKGTMGRWLSYFNMELQREKLVISITRRGGDDGRKGNTDAPSDSPNTPRRSPPPPTAASPSPAIAPPPPATAPLPAYSFVADSLLRKVFELLREQLWYRPNSAIYVKLIVKRSGGYCGILKVRM